MAKCRRTGGKLRRYCRCNQQYLSIDRSGSWKIYQGEGSRNGSVYGRGA
nr:MAG TPA: hypothetical protein [Caudoviricetes sp.]